MLLALACATPLACGGESSGSGGSSALDASAPAIDGGSWDASGADRTAPASDPGDAARPMQHADFADC